MGRSLDEAIGAIEAAGSTSELKAILQKIIENYGFASFAFMDVSTPGLENPLVIATNGPEWDREYRREGFVHVDPCLPIARRSNIPFTWGSVPLPERQGRRLPGALKTMQAAHDHGFREGIVIPFHYADHVGRTFSSVCTFFWKDAANGFRSRVAIDRHHLHIIMLYWAQRAVDLSAREYHRPARFLDHDGVPLVTAALTDRERDTLSWAARGKTVSETADILGISEDTVETHIRNAMRKLGATNKTHAAVKAIYLGLIDV
jgi:DNA-binding CsgD family transcriptional regulator